MDSPSLLETEPRTDAEGRPQSLTIEVESGEGVWRRQGSATMKFLAEQATKCPNDADRAGINVLDTPVLLSKFPTSQCSRSTFMNRAMCSAC